MQNMDCVREHAKAEIVKGGASPLPSEVYFTQLFPYMGGTIKPVHLCKNGGETGT